MDTTILLSTQRSGTTFLDKKLNGMCEILRLGGELIDPAFYNKHNIENLVKCDNLYDKNKHDLLRFYRTDDFTDNCYIYVNEHLLTSAVKKSNNVVFNIMLDAIKYNIELIKSIKTPILFLIRKNRWQRQISCYLNRNKFILSHIKDNNIKSINVKIDKSELIRYCEAEFNILRKFQKQLKNQKNIKIIYYEDIQNKEYWTDEFINELEDFMKVKFTNRNYIPPYKKTRNFVNIINEAEIMDEEYIKKYYIKKI